MSSSSFKFWLYSPYSLISYASLSILKSEQSCLQENLDSGKTVGICDEITSVYKCEFFWNQIAPMASNLVPTMFDLASGNSAAAKGGAEYLSVKYSWENTALDFISLHS